MDDNSLKFQLEMFIICQVTAFSKCLPNIRYFVEGKLAPALQSFQKLEIYFENAITSQIINISS